MEGGKGCRHVVVSSVFPSLVVVPTYSLKFMFLLKKKKEMKLDLVLMKTAAYFQFSI